jgi:hypothetical protein
MPSTIRITSCPGRPSGIRSFLRLLVVVLLTVPVLSAQGQLVLLNGDFEQADPANPAQPAHWDAVDGLGVQWIDAPAFPGAPSHGRAIRMDTAVTEMAMVDSYKKAGLTQWIFPHPGNSPIAESYGLSLYSEAIPVLPGKTYRVTFDYLSDKGTAGKLWFRAYADNNGEKKRVYEGTVDCGGKGGWKTFTGLFHPTRYRPNVAEFKIMLFTYYPAGVAWFDNIKVEAFDEPPP